MIVRPVCEADTVLVDGDMVPPPSGAYTVMLGEDARFASVPAPVEASWTCQVWAPVVAVAVAPGPPPATEPYVIVNVFPAASVSDETVIVPPATVRLPAFEVE